MKCPECEANLRRGAKFCDQCGAEIASPEKIPDLHPVVSKLLEGVGTGLKFLGEAIQDWAKSVKEEKKEEKQDDA